MSRTNVSAGVARRAFFQIAIQGLLVAVLLIAGGCKNASEPASVTLRYLVYCEDGKIRRISEDGAVFQDLTSASEGARAPKCSPDGSWIAYYATPDSANVPVGVYIMHQDGSAKTRIADIALKGTGYLENLRWSADSKNIFFESPKGGSHQLYAVTPVAGATAVKLTDAEFAASPVPSPNNGYLAYRGSYHAIESWYMLDLKISDPPRRLFSVGDAGMLHWSPDGMLLSFGGNFDSPANLDKLDLYTCAADGSALTRLTANGGSVARDWSPDGKRILYVSNVAGASSLCLMNADGSGRTVVASRPYGVFNAHFSADGRRLAFVAHATAASYYLEVYTIDLDGTNERKIASRCESDISWCN